MVKLFSALGERLTRIGNIMGIGKPKAIVLGVLGSIYAYSINDSHLMVITVSFSILAYFIYALELK